MTEERDQNPSLKNGKFRDLKIRLPISLLAAHLISGYRQKENFFELLLLPGYYPALLVSFCIASMIFYIINRCTRTLDRKYPWENNHILRLFNQIVYAVLFPLFCAFLMATLYFWCYNYHISSTVYFDSYFLLIVLFVLFINIYYNAEFIVGLRNKDVKDQHAQKIKNNPEQNVSELSIPDEANDFDAVVLAARTMSERHDVAYISLSNGVHYAKSSAGTAVLWFHNIKTSVAVLPADLYFQVKRNCIVRRDIIAMLVPDPMKRRLTIVLKEPFNEKIEIPSDNIPNFETWWHNA